MQALAKNRRAVSPVIATLLLIAISVAAAVVTYSWVMSMIASQGRQAQTSIRVDMVEFGGYVSGVNYQRGKLLTITVRNTGSVDATIATIYITGAYWNVTSSGVLQSSATWKIDIRNYNVITAGRTIAFEFDGNLKAVKSDGIGVDETVTSPRWSSDLWWWAPSTSYTLKVVTDTGFAIEGTYTSPAAT